MATSRWVRRAAGPEPGGGSCTTAAEEELDNAHLMRMAGRFARRVRTWAKANGIPVIDCGRGERKHMIPDQYLASHPVGYGLFLILVARAPASVWEVKQGVNVQDRQAAQKAGFRQPLLVPHQGSPVGAPDH